MRARWILGLCLVALGCSDDATEPPSTVLTDRDAATDSRECYDPDEDGFGPYCELGRDCDDEDPDVTDLCYRCATISQGCPCEPGTEPVSCKPKDEKVEGGLIVCSEGTYWCRDGVWSDCERIAQYTMFIPDP
jgi:hypothetical protein